jgi:molecular chaperone GrpE
VKNKTINNKEAEEKPAIPSQQKQSDTLNTSAPAAETVTDETPGNNKTCSISPEEQLKELQGEIESLRKMATERDEFLKLLQRVQADFLNYQKRIKKEKECWYKYQDEDLLKELMPALDNFERTLKMQCSSDDARCLMDGVQLIKREIFRVLEKRGVRQIKTIGEKFDANIHEAVAVTESSELKENEIIEEISPGFMLYDRLIRAAKVRIAARQRTGLEQTSESLQATKPKPKQEKPEEKETHHKDTKN